MVEYAAKDAEVLLPLKDKLISELEEIGTGKVVELEARFTPSMSYTSDNGFTLDVEGWKKHAHDAREALEEAEAECNSLARIRRKTLQAVRGRGMLPITVRSAEL